MSAYGLTWEQSVENIVYAQATSQTVAQSTALTEAQKPAAQQADQQEPNRIVLGAR